MATETVTIEGVLSRARSRRDELEVEAKRIEQERRDLLVDAVRVARGEGWPDTEICVALGISRTRLKELSPRRRPGV